MILLKNENFYEIYKTIDDKLEQWNKRAGVMDDPDSRVELISPDKSSRKALWRPRICNQYNKKKNSIGKTLEGIR